MLIEQALFTTDSTGPAGHRLVAASPGITPADLRELSEWAPVRGSLSNANGGAASVNFHPLPSGGWCVARTMFVGSSDDGERTATLSFVVQATGFARFANNPFALLRAIRAAGLLEPHGEIVLPLAPFQLPGRASAVDEGLVAQMADRWGAVRVAWLIQTTLNSDTLAIVGAERRDLLLAGLMNCLPIECRPEVSFSSGLAYSPRRPFRVVTVSPSMEEFNRLRRLPGMTVLDMNAHPPADFTPTGWANLVLTALESDRLTALSHELERPRPRLRLTDLGWLADQLLERLRQTVDAPPALLPTAAEVRINGARASREVSGDYVRFDGRKLPSRGGVDYARQAPGPSTTLDTQSPELLDRFERLDDLVFDTINGKQPALDELTAAWPKLSADLPPELLSESREQYLRYALKLWDEKQSSLRDPSWAVTALDVLSVLFGE
jgi:hypothetical protein